MTRLSCIVLAVALAGCGATEPTDPGLSTEFTFLMNGERWTANTEAYAILSDAPGLFVFAELRFDDRFPLRQSVGFSVPASEWEGIGTYPITKRSVDGRTYSAYVNESDGDATIANYYPVPSAPGEFEVTRYDEATGEIEGRFEGTCVVDPSDLGQPRRELPDTLRVTNGQFRAVVEDRR